MSNLRFADDIDLIAGSEEELQDLTNRLEAASAKFGMEISAPKSKILVSSPHVQPTTKITLNGTVLEEVDSFKYLGSMITKDGGSCKEIKARIGAATSAMAKLKHIWKSKDISLWTKIKLYKTLILSILLYMFDTWATARIDTMLLDYYGPDLYRKMTSSYDPEGVAAAIQNINSIHSGIHRQH